MSIYERMPRRTFLTRVRNAVGVVAAGGSIEAFLAACGARGNNVDRPNLTQWFKGDYKAQLQQAQEFSASILGITGLQKVNETPVLKKLAYYKYEAPPVASHLEERDILVREWKGKAPINTEWVTPTPHQKPRTTEDVTVYEYVDENLTSSNTSEGKLTWLFQKEVITNAHPNTNTSLDLDGYVFQEILSGENASSPSGADIFVASNLST